MKAMEENESNVIAPIASIIESNLSNQGTNVVLVSKEDLKAVMHAFSETLEGDSDKMAVEADFKLEGNTLTFAFPNALMAEKFGDLKTEIYHEIVKATGQQTWQLESEIAAADTKIKIYKTQDKFEAMVAKNPMLVTLKERLKLDLDF
jgi:hypothetical protein